MISIKNLNSISTTLFNLNYWIVSDSNWILQSLYQSSHKGIKYMKWNREGNERLFFLTIFDDFFTWWFIFFWIFISFSLFFFFFYFDSILLSCNFEDFVITNKEQTRIHFFFNFIFSKKSINSTHCKKILTLFYATNLIEAVQKLEKMKKKKNLKILKKNNHLTKFNPTQHH